ncbi:MAG: deoxyguanosinetriphosphate triphosphohydrolase [Candidatus Zixiibacteriota bacterium]
MYRNRQDLEHIADKGLRPYGCKNSESQGRRYPEPLHSYRLPYERDRERIIHSTAWRRLEYKTQVFVNHEGDHFRTRMTHSIEVATISRVISNTLGLNADLAEAISLAHDLGHTPFGHSGEEVLNDIMCDVGGFEHNRQSLRVVEFLEMRYPEFNGLNLCYETREGLIKHASRYDSPTLDLFSEDDKFPSLEAQVINLADELAYTCHDFDDGIYSGLLKLDEIAYEIHLIQDIIDEVQKKYGHLDAEMQRKQVVRHLINRVVTDCVLASSKLLDRFRPESVDAARTSPVPLITISENLRSELQKLGNYLFYNLYRNYKVIRMMQKAELVLTKLYDAFVKEPRQLPESTKARIDDEDIRIVVADYIAGMTDRYAMSEFKQLFDPYVKML